MASWVSWCSFNLLEVKEAADSEPSSSFFSFFYSLLQGVLAGLLSSPVAAAAAPFPLACLQLVFLHLLPLGLVLLQHCLPPVPQCALLLFANLLPCLPPVSQFASGLLSGLMLPLSCPAGFWMLLASFCFSCPEAAELSFVPKWL